MSYILECRNLAKNYGRNQALRGIDLNVSRGRITGLLGPNGSGKTTLLKLAAGLLTPSSGEILINGKAPGIASKACVSFLPDKFGFADWTTVKDALSVFGDFYRDFDGDKARAMLGDLLISPKTRIKEMSKGSVEKMQLVLAMSRHAELYLLDEPIGGVDPATRDYILDTVVSNRDPDSAVLISTHLISDIEKVLDDVLFLSGGNIVLRDTAENIRSSQGKSVDEFFREEFRC